MSLPEAKIKKYIYGCGIIRTLLHFTGGNIKNNLEVFYEADYIHILWLSNSHSYVPIQK